jgi:hypothetical protein
MDGPQMPRKVSPAMLDYIISLMLLPSATDDDLDTMRRQAEAHDDDGIRTVVLPAIEAEIAGRYYAATQSA